MTVHIHIYEGQNGPMQPNPPIQRPARPPARPAPVPPSQTAPAKQGVDEVSRLKALVGKKEEEQLIDRKEINRLNQVNKLQREAIDAEAQRANTMRACLLGLARQITGDGDIVGAHIKESLETLSDGLTDAKIIQVITKARAEAESNA